MRGATPAARPLDVGVVVGLAAAAALATLAVGGCGRGETPRRGPAAPPTAAGGAGGAPARAPAPPTAVAGIAFRFQDHLAEATITGPDPARALLTIGPRTRALVNPHGRAPRRLAYYQAQLAFPGGRVADYATTARWADDGPLDRGTAGATGLMGGGAGVVELRAGLLAPPDTTFTWRVTIPPRGLLAFEIGVAPSRPGAPVVTTVTIDGAPVWSQETAYAAAGRWRAVEVDLAAYAGRTVTLGLAARARRHAPTQAPVGPALFADPLLLAPGTFTGPSVVVLTLDAVRGDVLGANGSGFGITPNLDRLAADGTSFSQTVIAWTWTRPSVIAMLSGCHPGQLHAPPTWEVPQGWREQFYRGRPPLATLDFHRHGYEVRSIGNSILFVGYHPLGLDLGWDGADDVRDLEEETAATTRGVIAFLRQHRHRPFFLYAHLDTAHLPYNPPARLRAVVDQSPAAARYRDGHARNYLAEVAFADEQVGRVRAALEELGLAGRTLLVVTADHGENIDHDKYLVYPETGRNTIWGHGSTPYDNVLRVPLILWQPGRIPAGRRVDAQVRSRDLAPTLLDLAGLPPNPRQCSRSLAPLVRGESEPAPRIALTHSFYSTIVRDGAWKLIQWQGEAGRTRLIRGTTPAETMQELYHVAVDPREREELSARRPAELRRMRLLLAQASREARRPLPSPGPTAPPLAAAGAAPGAAPGAASGARTTPTAAAGASGAAVPVLHLRLGAAPGRHRLAARLRSSRPLAVRAAKGRVRVRAEDGHLVVEAESAAGAVPPEVAVEVDLDAAVELETRIDGAAVPAERLLVGPFSLALLSGTVARIDRATWTDLRAKAPPRVDGAGLFLWGEGDAAPAEAAAGPGAEPGPVVTPIHSGDVSTILKSWGYIQGGEKTTGRRR